MKIKRTVNLSSSPPSVKPATETRVFDATIAVRLSFLSYMTESSALDIELSHLGALQVHHFVDRKTASAHGFACIIHRQAWICFRGSDERRDWIANLSFLSKDGVHRGFLGEWQKFEPQVKSWLGDHETDFDTICTTGHSLGGAIAVLCARSSFDWYPGRVSQTITFGAPPVFYSYEAQKFAERKLRDQLGAEALRYRCLRIVHRNDAVTWLPLIVALTHVGEELIIGGRGLWGRLFDVVHNIDRTLGRNLPRFDKETDLLGRSTIGQPPIDRSLSDVFNTPMGHATRPFFLQALSLVSAPIWMTLWTIIWISTVVISALHISDSALNHFRIWYLHYFVPPDPLARNKPKLPVHIR